ncbi:hypothetical protein [Serratia silvae]|uniref:Uncharacterized protein n=1 Tax=Serratia silvae TaxID=2824122 RepID=A0ABT0KBV7_9GAMM|nr:hypothetical protein [Serratia silvae]MCL1029496.1 hypothetical protein [Serratia silvae]
MQQFIDELSFQKTYSNSRLVINDFPGVVVFAPQSFVGLFSSPRPSVTGSPLFSARPYFPTNGLPIYVELSAGDKGTLNSSYLLPGEKDVFL